MRTSTLLPLVGLVLGIAACAPVAPAISTPAGTSDTTKKSSDPSKQSDSSCGTITSKGICVNDGSVMKWCDGAKQLRETDCAYDAGFTCKVMSGEAKCVDAKSGGATSGGGKTGGSSTGCGNITSGGTCVNGTSVMKWCQNNIVLETDCAYDTLTDQTCQEADGVANCVETGGTSGGGGGGGGTPTGCGSITDKGICVNGGSKMQWCMNGKILDADCADDPENTCKMINMEAKCVPVGGSSGGTGGGGGGTTTTPPPLGGNGYPCWTYRDCQYDLSCVGASPSAQGMCKCVEGACLDNNP